MNEALRLLEEQGEVLFTTQQAYAVGLDDRSLLRLRKTGECVRLTRGLYVLGAHQAVEPEAAHVQLARGGLLLYPDAALSHESALLAHGFPVWRINPSVVHLQRPVQHQVRRGSFVIDPWWMAMPDDREGADAAPTPAVPVPTRAGPAVEPAVAVVQTTRVRGLVSGVIAADHGLHHGVFTEADLAAVARVVSGWPDSSAVGAALELADGSSESPGESRCRVCLTVAGFELVPQVRICDEHGVFVARVDFLLKGTKIALEFDGKVKYDTGDPSVLWAEKRREDRLRELGYIVIRVTWADLDRPQQLFARIRAAMAIAA